jgi:hypothetical protein
MSTSDMINSGSEFGEVQKRTFPSWLETQLETPSRGEAVAAQRDEPRARSAASRDPQLKDRQSSSAASRR